MTVTYNCIVLTTMCEQYKHTYQVTMSKIWIQQSTISYDPNHYKNKQTNIPTKKKAYIFVSTK